MAGDSRLSAQISSSGKLHEEAAIQAAHNRCQLSAQNRAECGGGVVNKKTISEVMRAIAKMPRTVTPAMIAQRKAAAKKPRPSRKKKKE